MRRALSLTEVVIALFLLSSVALTVISMTRMAFIRQRRNQHAVEATIIAQSTLNGARAWALDPDHYLENPWSAYHGDVDSPLSEYKVTARTLTRRGLYSPCASLEEQWTGLPLEGARLMPQAIVPLEVEVKWSNKASDRVRLLGYIGEPKRDIVGAQVKDLPAVSPSAPTPSGTAIYNVSVEDRSGRPFPNLLFNWNVNSDYLRIEGRRDGRQCTLVRDVTVVAPTPPTPPWLPVECTAQYAGAKITIEPRPVLLP